MEKEAVENSPVSGDGNLYYPPDANLEAKWSEGGSPDPEEFECLDSDGSYIPPDER